MAITRNKLVPVIGIVTLVIAGGILFAKLHGGGKTPDAKPAAQAGLPPAKGADQDNPTETLKTVVARQDEIIKQTQKVLDDSKRLQEQLARHPLAGSVSPAVPPDSTGGASGGVSPPATAGSGRGGGIKGGGITDAFGAALNQASGVIDTLGSPPGAHSGAARGAAQPPGGNATGTASGGAGLNRDSEGADGYTVLAPMGYAAVSTAGGHGKPMTVSYVRTSGAAAGLGEDSAARAAQAASQAAAAGKQPIPYFTLPENATLAGATAMTALIGRVPVDNRVADPMQFKAVVGRDNLAANGFELPGDIAGMIVSGVAVGDMTLSCSEGKIRSATFVFNDGAIRTISSGSMAGSVQVDQAASSGDLGYISDLYGNPCIQGKYVSNAPAYLTDIAAMKTLTALGQAYSAAQTQVMQSATTGTTSAVTGNMGAYAMGQAISAGSDEVSKWMLERLKSSFDAVVTPAGQQLVIHLNKELDIDKQPGGRKLVYRSQQPLIQSGERYGLE